MSPVIIDVQGGLVTLTLNRPDKKNALNREMVEKLREYIVELSVSGTCKLLVITGAGDAFCAGADLESLKHLQTADLDDNLEDSQALADLFAALYQFPGMLLAAVNGHALAGGCGLVTLCDVAVTHEKAKFGYTETRIGFVPALVSRYLMEKISRSEAARLLLAAQVIDANEAKELHLVHEVTSTENFAERIDWWKHHIMHNVSGQALLATKRLMRTVADMDLESARNYATRVNAAARMTTDCRRGIAAFLDKQPNDWNDSTR